MLNVFYYFEYLISVKDIRFYVADIFQNDNLRRYNLTAKAFSK